MRRVQCLKYLVLASMLMESAVDPFDAQEAAPYKQDPEVGVFPGGCRMSSDLHRAAAERAALQGWTAPMLARLPDHGVPHAHRPGMLTHGVGAGLTGRGGGSKVAG